MGRELKRKQRKKYEGNAKENAEVNLFTVSGFIRTVAGIVFVIFLSYFITAFFVTKELGFNNKNKDDNTSDSSETSSVNNKILASSVFSQDADEYYVYFYDFNDEDDKIKSYVDSLSPLYRVNTASGFNSKYVTTEAGNTNAKKLEDLKVKNPTVIKISKGSIVSYYEGVSSITDGLNK